MMVCEGSGNPLTRQPIQIGDSGRPGKEPIFHKEE